MHYRLYLKHGSHDRSCRRHASAALEICEVIDRKPVRQMRNKLRNIFCNGIDVCALVLLIDRISYKKSLTERCTKRVDRQYSAIGLFFHYLIGGILSRHIRCGKTG